MTTILEFVKVAAKSILSALAVAVAMLATLLTGNQNLSDVTFVQWLLIASSILATWGVVYAVPNKTPASPANPNLPLGGLHVGE